MYNKNIKLIVNIKERCTIKSLLKILAFIPLGIEFLLLIVSQVVLAIHIPIAILLTVIGTGIISNNKILKQSGNVSLIVLITLLCIMGYYDYLQWFSAIVGVVIFIYFAIIKIATKKVKNNIILNE